jgi:hypothetical protein
MRKDVSPILASGRVAKEAVIGTFRPERLVAALVAGLLAGCTGPAPPRKAGALRSAIACDEGRCCWPCKDDAPTHGAGSTKKTEKAVKSKSTAGSGPAEKTRGGKTPEPLGACSTYQFLGGPGCEISTKRRCYDRPTAVEWREGGVCLGWPPQG